MNGFARKRCFSDQHVHNESVEAHLAFGKAMKFGSLVSSEERAAWRGQERIRFGMGRPR
jgi:hypothetical protein